MRRPALMRLALCVGGLLVMILALTGCGSGSSQEEEAKARPLPEQPQELRPSEYRSEEFKPSLSFRVGKGWETTRSEASDYLEMGWEETGGLAFANVQKVYKATETSTPTLEKAPEDLVGWFQHHPYLRTSKPEPATVGGVKGVQFDVVAEVPKDHLSICGADCVDAIKYTGAQITYHEGDKVHAIVLEDVKGETVYIDYGALATDFDEVAPEAQKVLDSVRWSSS